MSVSAIGLSGSERDGGRTGKAEYGRAPAFTPYAEGPRRARIPGKGALLPVLVLRRKNPLPEPLPVQKTCVIPEKQYNEEINMANTASVCIFSAVEQKMSK
jgi:hypothetical protein